MSEYENESIELERMQSRAKYLDGRRDKFKSKYDRWVEKAKDANTFLRGVHDLYNASSQYGDSDERLPEDYETRQDRLFANISYSFKSVLKLVQYIRSDEGDVIVQPEGHTEEEQVDGAAIAMLSELFPDISNADRTAKLLTARIDLLKERSDIDEHLQDAAMKAATQRIAFCVGRWIEDEAEVEPFHLDVIKAGRFWFDPDAPTFKKARFVGYEECKLDKNEVLQAYGVDEIEGLEDRKYIDIEHHYTRDYSTVTKEGEIDGVSVTDTIYKYPFAWRYTVKVKGHEQVLYDGEMDTPGAMPPIRLFIWNKLPDSLMGVSVLDQTKDLNRNMDRCLETIQKWVARAVPRIFVDPTKFDESSMDEAEAGLFEFVNADEGGMNAAVSYYNGGGSPEGAYTLLEKLKTLGDEMIGVTGLSMDNAVRSDLSGDAIEGIAFDAQGVAGVNRDAWYRFLKEVYTMAIRFYMANERETVNVKMQGPQGIVHVSANLSAFGFNDKDFESKYDVSVFSPRNMPRNPVKRAQYLQQVIQTVMAMAESDPAAARIYLDSADVPMKQDLIGYVEKKQESKLMEQQAAMMAAQQAGQSEPDTAITDAALSRANDAAKSVGDSLEKLSNEAAKAGDLALAAELTASIPAKMNEAYNQIMNPVPTQPTQGIM